MHCNAQNTYTIPPIGRQFVLYCNFMTRIYNNKKIFKIAIEDEFVRRPLHYEQVTLVHDRGVKIKLAFILI